MSNRALYLKAAKELRRNPGQWAAYNSVRHCVVLAGPGSGKTKTLTAKLARLLVEEVEEPRGVACITYNNECARELESRLDALGVEPERRVFIGTVHSFSLTQIILPYAKSAGLGLPDQFSVATRAEWAKALERAFRRTIGGPGKPSKWEYQMSNYRRAILNRNSREWQSRDPKLARLVEAFEEELRTMERIDFDDMPLLAVRALRENKWLKRALYAKYPFLVVDEYQDLGLALHHIVTELCFGAGMRLFAVGDADQSIYGFTGARPELLQRLSERDDVETVHLRMNYRCGSQIVTASNYALGEERDYEAADSTGEGTIYFHQLDGLYPQQADYLFSTLLPDIQAHLPELQLGDIAIVYPAAWIGDALLNAAQKHGFAAIRTDKNSIYPRTSRLMRWLELCAQWCSGGWQTGSPRFTRLVNESRRLFAEVLQTEDDLLAFQRQLMTMLWENRDSTLSLHHWLDELRTTLLADLITACRTLQDEGETLAAFIERTADGKDCAEMVLGQFAGQGEGNNSINLSTLHSSKGREFSVVIMFGMDGTQIPRSDVTQRGLLEARRLFYVGFTRAKKELHLISSDRQPSPFVIDVQKRLDAGR